MKFERIRIVEIFGILGLILSLLFVGYEINQNNRVARSQARSDLAALNQEMLILQITDPVWDDLWDKRWGISPSTDLSDSEMRRTNFMMRLSLRKQENVYLQYAEGLLDESGLNSYGLAGGPRFQTSHFKEWWMNGRNSFNPGFVAFFEEQNEL